jgi:methylated-DNA-[protein]-cysteine S-methyltransferase
MGMSDPLDNLLSSAAARLDAPPVDHDRLTSAARAAGFEDVAYTTEASPLGELLLAATPRGVVMISYLDPFPIDKSLEMLASGVSPRVIEDAVPLDGLRRQLDEYFRHRRHEFDVGLDWALARGFTRRVLTHTATIPFGHVETYGSVARAIGNPRAARATGNALGHNPLPIVVPCHRVVRAGGVVGHYTGGPEKKLKLLEIEGR